MGQSPKELTPYESARHFFGAELRRWREHREISQSRLGQLINFDGSLIGKTEKAERMPSLELAKACDEALGTGGALVRLWPLVDQERQRAEGAESTQGHPAQGLGLGPRPVAGISGGTRPATALGTVPVCEPATVSVEVCVVPVLTADAQVRFVPVDRGALLAAMGAADGACFSGGDDSGAMRAPERVDYGDQRGFFSGQDVTITIPLRSMRLPDERLVIAQEDQQTANALARLCQRMDLGVERGCVAPDGGIDFSPEALVLVCGPKSSPVVDRLLATTDPALAFSRDQAGRWRLVDKATGAAFVSPMDQQPAQPGDCAYLGRLPTPSGRTFLLIAGVHAVGSLGVAHYLAQDDNLARLSERVGLDRFSMVIGCTFAGTARHITSSQALTPPRRH